MIPTTSGTGSPRAAATAATTWAGARDLGVVDRYQQHEIPQVAVTVTQYDQHGSSAAAGAATPPPADGARSGPVGYGPNLAAFAVYLMVVHFLPAHRVVALLESLTGTAPSVRVRARHAQPHGRAARPRSISGSGR